MFPALTSLTGGGGLSNSSPTSSSAGSNATFGNAYFEKNNGVPFWLVLAFSFMGMFYFLKKK